MIDKAWIALGVAAILIPALMYGYRLHMQVIRDMFDDADGMVDPSNENPSADPQRKSSAGKR